MKYLEADPERDRYLAQERLIFGATELVCQAIEDRELSRKELADRLGVSGGEITQRLNGNRNLTLRTLADMLDALGYDLELRLRDRCIQWDGVRDLSYANRPAPWDGATRYTRTGSQLRAVPTVGAA